MGTLEQRWFYRLSPANNKVFAIPQPNGSTHYITLRVTHILGESASEVGLAEDMTTTVLEQQRTVIGLGVDLLQGYYLSRPAAVPAPIAPAAQAVIDQLEHQRFDSLGL